MNSNSLSVISTLDSPTPSRPPTIERRSAGRTVPCARLAASPSDKNKAAVLALVERDGRARSFHVARVDAANLRGAIRQHVERDASIMTDEWRSYRGLGLEFASHETVSHGEGEYARGAVNTNS